MLYLTITINGSAVNGLFQIRKRDQHFIISMEDASKLHLKLQGLVDGKNSVDFSSKPGLKINYDSLKQVLDIQADKRWLGGDQQLETSNHRGLITSSQLSPAVHGVALNYDLYASHQAGDQAVTAYTELRSFGMGPGNVSSSFNSRAEQLRGQSDSSTQRLMT